MSRTDVRKTYKLYIGGAFPRSESGRTYLVNDSAGALLANAAKASRKDARDAVKAARSAFGGWAKRTAYNRGQVVYRIAEVLEGRREQFEAEIRASEGVSPAKARAYVDAAIGRSTPFTAPSISDANRMLSTGMTFVISSMPG